MNINRISHAVASIEELTQWADSGETSIEVAYAIMELATDKSNAMIIWGAPTDEQYAAVIKKAWALADEDEDTIAWGSEALRRADKDSVLVEN